MIEKILSHRNKISLMLGSLSVFALPDFYFFPILFLTFPLILLIEDRAKNFKESFKTGYWFGFGFFAFGLSWIGNALLTDVINFGWLYPICLISAGAFFGLFIALPFMGLHKIKNPFYKIITLAILWVLSEWIRSWILTGFPWNLLGTIWAGNDYSPQLASVFGTYGLSFISVIIFATPFILLKEVSTKNIIIAALTPILLIGLLFGYGYYRIKNNPIKFTTKTIRMVQPSIPQTNKWDRKQLESNFDEYINLSKKASLDGIDIVIWGETASPFPLDFDIKKRMEATKAISKKGLLITGAVRFEKQNNGEYKPYNSLFAIDKKGEIKAIYDKSHLVPFGEYIPLKEKLPFNVNKITNGLADFKSGNGNKTIKISDIPKFGALICYEIIFPSEVTNKNNHPKWLINLTNDGWYGDSIGPRQHLASAKLRAIEEGIPVVRVANTGISAIISATGIITKSIPLNENNFIDGLLPKEIKKRTFYSTFIN